MRRFLLLGLSCAALCGLGVAATTASALPAFFQCVKVKGGKFQAGCKAEGGKGGFELREGIAKGKVFKGTGTTLDPFAPVAKGGEMKCEKTKLVGALSTATRMTGLQVTQTGCIGGVGEKSCTSGNHKRGTIVSSLLEGTLGYVNAAEHSVGLDLKAEGGGNLWSADCEGLTQEISGSLIGAITPLNTFTKTYTITFTRDSEKFQSIKKFEGEPEDVPIMVLNGSGPWKSSIAGSLTYKGELMELKG
jgi:hypothetical protein